MNNNAMVWSEQGLFQIDLVQGMMDCLYAECKPCITDCVLAELEKLGQKYRVALKVAKASFSSPFKSMEVPWVLKEEQHDLREEHSDVYAS